MLMPVLGLIPIMRKYAAKLSVLIMNYLSRFLKIGCGQGLEVLATGVQAQRHCVAT